MIWLTTQFHDDIIFLPSHTIGPLIINNRDVIARDGQRYMDGIHFGNLFFMEWYKSFNRTHKPDVTQLVSKQ